MQRWLPLIIALPFLSFAACPPPQCAGDGDCGEDQFCAEGSCFDNIQVGNRGNRDAGPVGPGPGGDGGPNPAVNSIDDELLTTQEPRAISWLLPDTRTPGRASFPEYQDGAFDVLRSFSVNDGALAPDENLAANLDPCNVDTASQFVVPGFPNSRTELWIHCSVAPNVRVIYDNDFSQEYTSENDPQLEDMSAQVTFKTNGNNGNFERLLLTSRGGSVIRSLQLSPNDPAQQTRIEDTFATNLTFTSVVSMHPIEESLGNQGDHVLVFDAGANALVPMILNGEIWEPHPALAPLTLDPGARAVVLMGRINANNVTDNSNAPNVAVVYPGEARVRFYNFEDAAELDAGGVLFEPNPSLQSVPPVSERVLVGLAPSGDAIHYTHASLYRTYYIPLRAVDGDVRMFEANPIARRLSGLVVADEDEVWVSYGTDPQGPIIERVRVDQFP